MGGGHDLSFENNTHGSLLLLSLLLSFLFYPPFPLLSPSPFVLVCLISLPHLLRLPPPQPLIEKRPTKRGRKGEKGMETTGLEKGGGGWVPRKKG